VASIGQAFIDVHANTGPFDRELARDLDRAADDAEGELNKTGNKIGDDISDGIGATLRKRGKKFAKSIEDGTKNTIVRVRSIVRFDRIRDSIRRTFRRDVGDTIQKEIGDALDRSTRRGGIFTKFGMGIADAIGAGFNVSGRSPLIAILIPALAALVGVIGAAIQAVNALVAVLFIIPGLLASIGLQVGVVMVAFQGLGEAVQGAFAAKNAKELREALKGLTPSARSFVRELLPLKGLFAEIQKRTQEAFFLRLAGAITTLRKALGPSLIKGFQQVAGAAGTFTRSFIDLLSSPAFVKFFNTLVPATTRWLNAFAGSLFGKRGFVTALITMATALMPFMEKFGEIILRNLDTLSGLIFRLAGSPATQEWLDRMAATLQMVFDLLFNIGDFLFVFMRELDRAGGQNLIKTLSEALMQLSFFFSSPAGQKAMEGLVNLGIIGIRSFTGLIEAIFLVLAAFQFFSEWLKDTAVPAIIHDVRTLVQALIDMSTFLGVWIERIVRAIGSFFAGVGRFSRSARDAFVGFVNGILTWIAKLVLRIKQIPKDIIGGIGNLGSLLINSGRALINGLIEGINQKINALRSVLSQLAGMIGGFIGLSPAKEGPLSGQGWTKYRGQHMIQDLIDGIRSEVPDLRKVTMNAVSNIVFGSNSVQVNVAGGIPDQNQARTAGNAMGAAAANMIASRNTRLAVRTL
jgi:hypothetical protein